MVESPLLTSRWPSAVQAQATIFTSSGTSTGRRLARPERRFRPTPTGRSWSRRPDRRLRASPVPFSNRCLDHRSSKPKSTPDAECIPQKRPAGRSLRAASLSRLRTSTAQQSEGSRRIPRIGLLAARLREPHRPHDGVRVRGNVGHLRLDGEGGVRVLQAVAGDYADDGLIAEALRYLRVRGARPLQQAGHAGRRGWLGQNALLPGQQAVRLQDLLVRDGADGAAGLVAGGGGAPPAPPVTPPHSPAPPPP